VIVAARHRARRCTSSVLSTSRSHLTSVHFISSPELRCHSVVWRLVWCGEVFASHRIGKAPGSSQACVPALFTLLELLRGFHAAWHGTARHGLSCCTNLEGHRFMHVGAITKKALREAPRTMELAREVDAVPILEEHGVSEATTPSRARCQPLSPPLGTNGGSHGE
jgi:hypothetical protein